MSLINASSFSSFSDLEKSYQRDIDFRVCVQQVNSSIAIVAPHGGGIEPGTSDIAKAIAAEDFNLYLFEGIRTSDNYRCLHLSSTRFDDEHCLNLIKNCQTVISIHGCRGDDEFIYLGGLDKDLKQKIYTTLSSNGFQVNCDHPELQGKAKSNICNRGLTGQGVQIELSKGLRKSQKRLLFVNLIRQQFIS